jgi:ATP-dependent exoDNAse (exonuclease V) beta subunit
LRLLYVASTRAKDRLIVPFIGAPDATTPHEPESLNDWLRRGSVNFTPPIDAATLPAIAASLPVWRRTPEPAPAAASQRIVDERARWFAEHDALVARAKRPLVVRTASALKPEWERPVASTDDVRRGNATEFGSAVHALLERSELRADAIHALARAVAEEFGMPARADEMAQMAQRALESTVVQRALRSSRLLLEAPFTVALPVDDARAAGLPEGLAEGRIDLLFEDDGAVVIVDFKTDAVTERDVDERTAHYRNQALVYAWAVRTATRMPVREVAFLFARPGIERAYAVDEAFIAEAAALMCMEPTAEAAIAPAQEPGVSG